MVLGTEVTRLMTADERADRSSTYLHTVLLLALAATMTYCARAQNIEGQPIAAQYGEFEVQNEGNGFAFDPANCNVTGGGENFPAFTTGTPVKVVDALPAQTEVSTAVNAFLSGSNCAVSLGGLAYQHTSFYLTSGTGGLQEALNNEKIRAGGNNTIILNARWYELVAPRSASAVINTVSGSYSFGLIDITTNPYTSYNWNGSQYVQAAAASSGPPNGAAGGALSGNYPNPGLSSNPIALPAGSTATTCTVGENDTKVATNGCVQASLPTTLPPNGAAAGSLSGTYPNPGLSASLVLPSATTATTQTAGDNTTKVATDAFVIANGGTGGPPTGTAGGSLSGNYPNPGLSPTVAIPVGASIPSVGTIKQVDGFVAYSACVARGAWSSATAYNPCDTVTNGGLTWIAVNANINVTPVQSSLGGTQNWLQFRSDGANVAATMADYAFFSAFGIVNLNSTSFTSNASVSLVFGAPVGAYLKNGDWVMPSNVYGYTISLLGQGRGQTIITQNTGTRNYMVAQPPASASGGQTIAGIEFNANLLAAGCVDAHIRRSTYRDLVCFNPQYQSGQTQIGSQTWNGPTTAATFLFGFGGDSYELDVSQILTRTPTYSGLVAAIGTATVTSGAITGVTYTNSGTNLNLPVTAGPGLVAYFMGKGASGTSYQPCGTMPVVSAIALTAGAINTGTGIGGLTFSSAGATCGGTIYVVIQQAGTIPYGYYFGSTDSSFNDIVTSGDFTQACQYDQHGSNAYDHEHPYCKAPYQIVANGGGPGQATDTHKAIEFDSPTQYGMYILRAGEAINSYTAQWNSTTGYPGAGEFLLDSTANSFSIGPSWCGGFQQAGGYAKFTGTATGTIYSTDTSALGTLNAYIYGNQANCDGTQNPAGFETTWGQYLGKPLTFPATGVLNVKALGAVGNGSSNQACTYLGLANLAALQAYAGGIYSFATACTNQMDWLATQYAVNLLTATGGTVKLPSGAAYLWDQPLILPIMQDSLAGSAKGVYLAGDGEGGTIIEPSVADFGANSAMVSCGLPTASYSDNSGAGSGRYGSVGACYGGITDLTFYNPFSDQYNGFFPVNVTSSTYAGGITGVPAPATANTTPISMDGVMLGGRMYLRRVGAWGFRMGFNLVGDHMTWDQLDAEKDFCGIYWAPPSIYLVGDIILKGHTFFSGNTFAGTCVDKQAAIIGFYQTGEVYTGYQPYGWIKFPGISTNYGQAFGGAYTPFFANVNYDIIQSEAIGNAVMWDDNLTNSGGGVGTGQSSIGGVNINGIYTVFNNSINQKLTAGGRGPYAYIGAGSINGLKIGNIYAGAGDFYPTTGQLAGIIAQNAAYNDGGIDISGDMTNLLNQYTSIEFVGLAASGSTMCQNVSLHLPGVWDGGEIAVYPAATEPVPGNLLQVYNFQSATIANGTQPVTGVAMQTLTTNTAGGQCVAYANRGSATVLTTSTPPLGSLLVASSTAGKATAATATAGGYAVGAVQNNIANPPVRLSLGGFTSGTSSLSAFAPLASPALTGTPTAPTATANTNNTQLATTAYAQNPGPITPTTVTASGVVTAPGLWPQTRSAGPYATLFDDYFSGANNASNNIGTPSGSSCAVNTTYVDINHPGNLLLTSGTGGTGTGITCGYQNESADLVTVNASLGWTWETAVYLPVLPGTTAGAYQAGLTNGPNANPWTTGVQFYLSSANSVTNDWYCRYSSTSTDSTVAAVVGWQRLTVVSDGTNVHWYVNGTQVCGTGTAVASMPSSTMYPASWSATALSATSVAMAVDYVDLQRAVSR